MAFFSFVSGPVAAQDLEWAKQAGGTEVDNGHGITVDGSGNSYVTGIFRGTATFGGGEANKTVLISSGWNDIFVAKYKSDGLTGLAALNEMEPASLLVYPYFSSEIGEETLISVTNINTCFVYTGRLGWQEKKEIHFASPSESQWANTLEIMHKISAVNSRVNDTTTDGPVYPSESIRCRMPSAR